MAKVNHNPVRCQSTGICESLAPENFEFNQANELVVLGDGTVTDAQLAQVREAIAGCPNLALTLLDDSGEPAGS